MASFRRDSRRKRSFGSMIEHPSLFKSSSAFEDTAFSVKAYSSVCRPVPISFGFVLKEAHSIAQHSAKISPTLSCLPEGKNKFSKDTLAPPDVKLAPQNLQLLLWRSILGFLTRLQGFVGVDIPCYRICSSTTSYEKKLFKPLR